MKKIIIFLGAIALSSGMFGDDIESAVLYSIDCSGNETGVLNCSFSQTGTCGHSAAVVCQGTQQIRTLRWEIFFKNVTYPQHYSTCLLMSVKFRCTSKE